MNFTLTSRFIPAGQYVTVEDYAREAGVSPATIKRRCARGDLREQAVKVGRQWLIWVSK